jgi:broad specificity phosphatase PhoE
MGEITTIYLIRHAAYENPKKIFHGRLPGFPLSATGQEQAKKLAVTLKKKPIVAVYSSPLTRAFQTAHIIARQFALTVKIDKQLMDIRTPFQGKPLEYIHDIKGDMYKPEFIAMGGERLREVFERMDSCIRDIVKRHPGQHIAVVSHGDPIMSIRYKYQGTSLPRKFPYDQSYVQLASGYEIRFKNDSVLSLSPLGS